jgi:precorrin-2 dehydrogenase/sirohydrochlorin ferrochelatase
MIPLFLDPAEVTVGLVGRGPLAERRLEWLRQGGAAPQVFSDEPSPALTEAAGPDLALRLPNADDLKAIRVLWIADLPLELAEPLHQQAMALGVLANVEDVPHLCPFHTPAVVRRGRLSLAISTAGNSPAVASEVRARLERLFPETWAAALDEIAAARKALRAEGADPAALKADALARLKALDI